LRVALALCLQYRFRHLLGEERDAIGTFDDVLLNVGRQRLVADDALYQDPDVSLRQPIESHCCHIGLSDPGRTKFRPERHDQQHRKGLDPSHHPTDDFQTRGVDPMRILDDHQHGIFASSGHELRHKCFQRSFPAAL
jgi:hypothetical protein